MFERPLEYGVRELVACPGSAGGQVAHVLEDGVCGGAGLARHLVLVQQLLQQRLLERLAAVAPQLLGAAPLRRVQRHLVHSPLQMFTMNTGLDRKKYLSYLGRGSEVVQCVLLQRVRGLQLLRAVELRGVQPPRVLPSLQAEQRQDVTRRLQIFLVVIKYFSHKYICYKLFSCR